MIAKKAPEKETRNHASPTHPLRHLRQKVLNDQKKGWDESLSPSLFHLSDSLYVVKIINGCYRKIKVLPWDDHFFNIYDLFFA